MPLCHLVSFVRPALGHQVVLTCKMPLEASWQFQVPAGKYGRSGVMNVPVAEILPRGNDAGLLHQPRAFRPMVGRKRGALGLSWLVATTWACICLPGRVDWVPAAGCFVSSHPVRQCHKHRALANTRTPELTSGRAQSRYASDMHVLVEKKVKQWVRCDRGQGPSWNTRMAPHQKYFDGRKPFRDCPGCLTAYLRMVPIFTSPK